MHWTKEQCQTYSCMPDVEVFGIRTKLRLSTLVLPPNYPSYGVGNCPFGSVTHLHLPAPRWIDELDHILSRGGVDTRYRAEIRRNGGYFEEQPLVRHNLVPGHPGNPEEEEDRRSPQLETSSTPVSRRQSTNNAASATSEALGNRPSVAPENFAWVCDICKDAKFRTFEEALEHENNCGWVCDLCNVATFPTLEEAMEHENNCICFRFDEVVEHENNCTGISLDNDVGREVGMVTPTPRRPTSQPQSQPSTDPGNVSTPVNNSNDSPAKFDLKHQCRNQKNWEKYSQIRGCPSVQTIPVVVSASGERITQLDDFFSVSFICFRNLFRTFVSKLIVSWFRFLFRNCCAQNSKLQLHAHCSL